MKLTSNILSLVTTFACAALTAALPLNAAEPERIEHKSLPATSGGSISLEDVKGNADVETADGSIKVGNVDGNVSAHTAGGSIKVAKR